MSDLRRQLPKVLRLLGSDKDGDVLAAARAIARLLDSGEADFHDLAAIYENNGIAEQRFARANISQFDPTGERALERWRTNLKMTGLWLKNQDFHRLPEAWQQFAHTLARSEPHVLSTDEEITFERVQTRLANWREKRRKIEGEKRWK
jgi:hypothetical protein